MGARIDVEFERVPKNKPMRAKTRLVGAEKGGEESQARSGWVSMGARLQRVENEPQNVWLLVRHCGLECQRKDGR